MPGVHLLNDACVLNSKIYVIGIVINEANWRSRVYEYDRAEDSWTEKAEMPTVRNCMSSCAVNNSNDLYPASNS